MQQQAHSSRHRDHLADKEETDKERSRKGGEKEKKERKQGGACSQATWATGQATWVTQKATWDSM